MTITDCLDYSRIFSLIELMFHPHELRMNSILPFHCQRYSRLSGPMLKSRSSMLRFGRNPCFASYTW